LYIAQFGLGLFCSWREIKDFLGEFAADARDPNAIDVKRAWCAKFKEWWSDAERSSLGRMVMLYIQEYHVNQQTGS
jgi:hypothetical protein